MTLADSTDRRPPPPRRRKVAALIVFYLVAFSATIPCIEVGDGRAARLRQTHDELATRCRQLEKSAQAAGRAEEAQRLARVAAQHVWFADAYRREASRTRWTWSTWAIKTGTESVERCLTYLRYGR